MRFNVNIEKRHAFVIMSLLVLGIGVFVVNALTAGETPNPGHNIQSVGPPSGCVSGQVLRFIDGSWDCVSVSADGYNPDNQPTASVRGEPTRAEIESWGDKYDTDTNTHGTCWVSGYANCVWDYAGTYEQLLCPGNKFMRSYDQGGSGSPSVYCCDIVLSCN